MVGTETIRISIWVIIINYTSNDVLWFTGPTICTAGPELGFRNLQRQAARNLADSQQYSQVPAQMQFSSSVSANRPPISLISGGSTDTRNFQNLQRARTNFPAVSNIACGSTKSSGGIRSIHNERYGNLQNARNQFCPVADICEEMYSQNYSSGVQPLVQSTSNYAVSYDDVCTDNNCDNAECDNR